MCFHPHLKVGCNCEAFAIAVEKRTVFCVALDEATVLYYGEAWIENQSTEVEAYY